MEEGLAEEAVHVFSWPVDASLVDGSSMVLALVVMRRQGGFMLALPMESIPGEDLDGATEDSLVGPHTVLTVPGGLRDEASGEFRRADVDLEVLVVDLKEEAQVGLEPFDASVHSSELVTGFAEELAMVPDPSTLLAYTKQWIGVMDAQRVNFYSADEGDQAPAAKVGAKAKTKAGAAVKGQKQMSAKKVAEAIGSMSELLPSLSAQLVAIQEEQRRMQEAMRLQAAQSSLRPGQAPVSSSLQQFMALTGPPPKTKGLSVKPPPPRVPKVPSKDTVLTMEEQSEQAMQAADPVELAVLEQSRALTTLVAHLQQGDPLIDAPLSSSGTSSRGAQGREKLQRELADRTGGFFLQVLQNAYKRMYPASQIPASVEEMAATGFAMSQYLERFGGYGQSRDLGIVQYGLSFVIDAAMNSDLEGVREHLALLAVSIEQTVMDGGRWGLGYQLSLLEDVPHQVWASRIASSHTGRMRSFAPLCPQRWATISLAYIKEMDYIANRRQDPKKGAPVPQPVAAPKQKGRFPKGKGGDSGQGQEQQE